LPAAAEVDAEEEQRGSDRTAAVRPLGEVRAGGWDGAAGGGSRGSSRGRGGGQRGMQQGPVAVAVALAVRGVAVKMAVVEEEWATAKGNTAIARASPVKSRATPRVARRGASGTASA